jgi:PPM family protein phosphatase
MRRPIHSHITLFAASDRGLVREKNEDAYIAMTVSEPDENPFAIRALLAVADGMGGHAGGELASRAAVGLLDDIFSKQAGKGLSDFSDIQSAVTGIISEADRRVRKVGSGEAKPPGTTLTAAFIVGNDAYIGHIGDSRAYQVRHDEIVAVTEDDSYVGRLVREGKLTPDEARRSSQKNILTKSLGGGEAPEFDPPVRVSLSEGDILMLCTDGLWALVTEEDIVGIIHAEKTLRQAAGRMIALAKARGGHDNITVAAAEIGRFERDPALAAKGFEKNADPVPRRRGTGLMRIALMGMIVLLSIILAGLVAVIVDPGFPERILGTPTHREVFQPPYNPAYQAPTKDPGEGQ